VGYIANLPAIRGFLEKLVAKLSINPVVVGSLEAAEPITRFDHPNTLDGRRSWRQWQGVMVRA
jgi:hypothetical protein